MFKDRLDNAAHWAVEEFSCEHTLRNWSDHTEGLLDSFVADYRRFVNGKYRFARKHGKAVFIDRNISVLKEQFFHSPFMDRFYLGKKLSDSDLDRVYWCICAADYLAPTEMLTLWPKVSGMVFSGEDAANDTLRYARYDAAMGLLEAMHAFAFDLTAHEGEQRRRSSLLSTTHWVYDFPYFSESLLLSRQLSNDRFIERGRLSHIAAAVVLRAQVESIAYRRDVSARCHHVSEQVTAGKRREIYDKIDLLSGVLGQERTYYLRQTYSALNFAVHRGLNFSHGEVWLFLSTVRQIQQTLMEAPL